MATEKQFIQVSMPNVGSILSQLSGFPKEAQRANFAAAKRATDHTVKIIGQIVAKRYAIKSGALKRFIAKSKSIRPSQVGGTQGYQIVIKGKLLPVTAFPHTIAQKEKQGPGGVVRKSIKVSARILRSGRRKRILRRNEDGSVASPFLKMPQESSDSEGIAESAPAILVRKSRQHGPLMEPKTLSVPQMITNEEVAGVITQEAQQMYMNRLEHEVEYRISKMAERVSKA